MKRKYNAKPQKNVEIAEERIKTLFKEAEKATQSRANRYVEIARKIAMKLKIRIPVEYKRRYCKHCNAYLTPGKNLRVRMQQGKVVYTCLDCGKHMRYRK